MLMLRPWAGLVMPPPVRRPPFAHLAVLLPVSLAAAPDDEWKPGAWTHPGDDARVLGEQERTAPFLNREPVEDLVSTQRRWWRSVRAEVAPGLRCQAMELVHRLDLTTSAPSAYLVVHIELMRGQRGGATDALRSAAELARPRRALPRELVAAYLPGAEVDGHSLRAATVALTAASGTPPLVEGEPDVGAAWLAVLAELPLRQGFDATGTLDRLESAGPMRALVTTSAIAYGRPPGARTFVAAVRGHVVDALLLGVLQRDTLLGFSRELATRDDWSPERTLDTSRRFDEFRRRWWWQVLADDERLRPALQSWRRAGGTELLMAQLVADFADQRAELRAERSDHRGRRAEWVASFSLAISVLAFLLSITSLFVGSQ